MLRESGEAILEYLALGLCHLPKATRRNTRGAMESTYEIGEIRETYIEGDVGDRARIIGQQARRTTQPQPHEILMRRDAEHLREQPQEVKRAQTHAVSCAVEIDALVGMRVEP